MQTRVITAFDHALINQAVMPADRFVIAQADLFGLFREVFAIARRIMPAPQLHLGVSQLSHAQPLLPQLQQHTNVVHVYGIPDASLMGASNIAIHKLRHNAELGREFFLLVQGQTWQFLIVAAILDDTRCEAIMTQDPAALAACAAALAIDDAASIGQPNAHSEFTAQLLWYVATHVSNIQQLAQHAGELAMPLGFAWVLQRGDAQTWAAVAESFRTLSHAQHITLYQLSVSERILTPLTTDGEAVSLQADSPLTRAIFANQVIRDQGSAHHRTVLPIVEAEQVWGVLDLQSARPYTPDEIDTFKLLIEVIRLAMHQQRLPDQAAARRVPRAAALTAPVAARDDGPVALSGKYVLDGVAPEVEWPDLDDFEQAYLALETPADDANTRHLGDFDLEAATTQPHFDFAAMDNVIVSAEPDLPDPTADAPDESLISTLMAQQRQYTELNDEAARHGPSPDKIALYEAFAIDMRDSEMIAAASDPADVLAQFDLSLPTDRPAPPADAPLLASLDGAPMDVLADFDLPDRPAAAVSGDFDLSGDFDQVIASLFPEDATLPDVNGSAEPAASSAPLDQLAAELQTAKANAATLRSEIDALEQELDYVQHAKAQAEAQLQQERDAQQTIAAQLAQTQDGYERLQRDYAAAQAQQAQLQAAYDALQHMHEGLLAQIETLQRQQAEAAWQALNAEGQAPPAAADDPFVTALLDGIHLFAARVRSNLGRLHTLEPALPATAHELVEQIHKEVRATSDILGILKQQAAQVAGTSAALGTVIQQAVAALDAPARERGISVMLPAHLPAVAVPQNLAMRAFYNIIFGIFHVAPPDSQVRIEITQTPATCVVQFHFAAEDRWQPRLEGYLSYFNQGMPQPNSFAFANATLWQLRGTLRVDTSGAQPCFTVTLPNGA